MQLGDGTVARQEEEADIALPAAPTVEVDMNVPKGWAGPAWIKANKYSKTFIMVYA